MALDVWSPNGRRANRYAQRLARRMAVEWGLEWVPTPEDGPARVDGLFLKAGRMVTVAELKVRTCERAYIEARGDEYLISAAKLDRGREVGLALGVPFVLIVLLQGDLTAYWWRITDRHGRWAVPFRRERTATRATCNGGEAHQLNAFLPMASAKSLDLSGEP